MTSGNMLINRTGKPESKITTINTVIQKKNYIQNQASILHYIGESTYRMS